MNNSLTNSVNPGKQAHDSLYYFIIFNFNDWYSLLDRVLSLLKSQIIWELL